jgi:hypothetical protein
MPRSPYEFFFKRGKPFMERTVRDDVVALVAGLVGFTAAYLLSGDDQPSVFAVFGGAALVVFVAHGVVRHVIRQRRDAASRMAPPD